VIWSGIGAQSSAVLVVIASTPHSLEIPKRKEPSAASICTEPSSDPFLSPKIRDDALRE